MPQYIYLDLNKWIELARGYHMPEKHPSEARLFEDLEGYLKSRDIVIPLSTAHYIEMQKIRNESRRRRLAIVMSILSCGRTIANPSMTISQELQVLLSSRYPEQGFVEEVAEVFGYGPFFAFGREASISHDFDVSEACALYMYIKSWSLEGTVSLLIGEDNLNKSVSLNMLRANEQNCADHAERRRVLQEDCSKEMRRRAYMVILLCGIQDHLIPLLDKIGISLEDMFAGGVDQAISIMESCPTLNMEIEMATQRDFQKHRPAKQNDMFDISALSVAVPYCDYVVTEKDWAGVINRRGLSAKYQCHVLTSLSDLVQKLRVGGV